MTSFDELSWLARLAEGKTVCEVGSWHGGSVIAMAETAKRVHSVDWHRGMYADQPDSNDTLPAMWANLKEAGVLDKVVLHVGRTENVAPYLAEGMFDMVFIDADHSYESVRRDYHLMRGKARHNAVFAFHDYNTFDGVTRFVDELGGPDTLIASLAVVGG